MLKKAISLIVSCSLLLTQPVFAQGVAELNIGKYLSQMPAVNTDSFRPAHLRYISYDIKSNDFKLLLDQGDFEKSPGHKVTKSPEKPENILKNETQNLFNYFLIGLSLPNEKFWVNLRPDAPEQIIDPELEKTDMGRIMLEADLQLKKDTAGWTSPQNPEGREYWDKLYKKAGELFGSENITIPTITRPWIVPGEVIIRESEDSSYIYKANLKVMLEEDYLNSRPSEPNYQPLTSNYNFSDPRMKELNKYSTQLIRELILPQLTQEINTAKKYAQLRQVFFSLILSRWFKDRFKGKPGQYSSLIDSHNLDNLTSKDPWSKDYYFNEYKKSFQQGEYNLKEQITTPTGQAIRSYMSGGTDMTGSSKPLIEGGFKAGSPLSEDTLVKILDKITKFIILAGFVYLVYPKSLYPTFISSPPKLTQLEAVLSEQDDSDARRAVVNLLQDEKLPPEDLINLRFYLANYAALENKELLRSAEEALRSFNNKQEKYTITLRLETIIKILKKTTNGSSPLVVPDEDLVAYRKNTEQMVKKFYDTYIMNGEYKGYHTFSNAKNAQDIKNILTSIFKNQMLTNYPDAGNKAKVAREIIEEYFLIEFNAEHPKDSIVRLKEDGASSALTKTDTVPTQMAETRGGIDFTRINYLTQPMGSFQGLDLRLPLLSKAELKGIDVSWELAALDQMINAKIEVSTDRLKRLLAAMSQKDAFTAQRETQLLPLLLRLCWLKEERGVETTPDFRAVLLIADTGLFVEQGKGKYSLN